jgi:hypothetical protein
MTLRPSYFFLSLVFLLTCSHGSSPPVAIAPAGPTSCGLAGDAIPSDIKALNLLKNREAAPSNVNPGISLSAMLQPGSDSTRFSTADGAEIEAVIYDVLVGGVETANCHATDAANRDTHMEMVVDGSHTSPAQRIVCEVTPRWRTAMAATGGDWSTSALVGMKGRRVRLRGWMLYDFEHATASENTAPGKAGNWRASAWEIHPITSITVLPNVPLDASKWNDGHPGDDERD